MVDEFHNPYTFVPMPPRSTLTHGQGTLGLGDDEPAGHDLLRPDLWSGTIGVTMTTETPLLLLDTAAPKPLGKDHFVYGPLLRDGQPHLPPTAVKGMLRAAYEAATNSRFGVFIGHTEALGYRPNAKANLVPARVTRSGDTVELLLGTSSSVHLAQEKNPVMHAAWLPRWRRGRNGSVNYPGGVEPEHKDPVRAYMQLIQHHRWDRDNKRYEADFRYWRVLEIARRDQPLRSPRPLAKTKPEEGKNYHEPLTDQDAGELGSIISIENGVVFLTNRNFSRKHDERVFFGTVVEKRVDRAVFTAYSVLVADYRRAHRDEDIHRREDDRGRSVGPEKWIGKDPGKTAWSPHLYDDERAALHGDDLCYAEVDEASGEVVGLYPVMVSRKLYEKPPACLVPELSKPAGERGGLSPADRVFGWVNNSSGRGDAGGHGAYRGQLRVGPVDASGATVETFEGRDGHGFPLAILGQPKPQQGRFYATAPPPRGGDNRKKGGKAAKRDEKEKIPKEGWYTRGGSLRGRKVYPHHAGLPEGYWKDPTEDRTQRDVGGRYQEYRRPRAPVDKDGRLVAGRYFETDPDTEQRDNQNRSVTGWVARGSVFRFTLDVRNLSDIELGGLFWILTLPSKHYHRLGLGKPLGFGSMRLCLDDGPTVLRRGRQWREYYASFADAPPGANPDVDALKDAFLAASDIWPGRPHLEAFLAAARGDEKVPVHYPRVRPEGESPYGMAADVPVPPDPRGQAYAWFVQNERVRGRELLRGSSLPEAGGDPLTVYGAPVRKASDAAPAHRRNQPRPPQEPATRAASRQHDAVHPDPAGQPRRGAAQPARPIPPASPRVQPPSRQPSVPTRRPRPGPPGASPGAPGPAHPRPPADPPPGAR